MLNFKKIVSVLASTVMIGSTIGLAVAANYPAPFVAGGNAPVAVVYGSNLPQGSTDLAAVTDVAVSLQAELAKQTASSGSSSSAVGSGGDSVNLGSKGSRKIYYGDAINAPVASLSSNELPSVLGDAKVVDLKGTEYSYTQTIKPGATVSVFGTSGGDIKDPVLYLDAGTVATAPLYNYTLSFTKNLNVTDTTNVQGQKIKILGVEYVIGASSTATALYLYGAGQTVTVAGGESKTVSVGGKDHTIDLVSTSSSDAKLTVDGVSKTVTKGSSYSYTGDFNVYVKDITHPAYAGDIRNIELILGANTLLIGNGNAVKQGADQTTIKGTTGNIVAANTATGGTISGFTVAIAMAKSQLDHIGEGDTFTDPVFGGLKVQFGGAVPKLTDTDRSKVIVETDNNQYGYVSFTSARAGSKGEQRLTYVYDNDTTATAIQPLLAHQSVASNKGQIHVLEGENALVGDWIVINQGDAGAIISVDDISIDTAAAGTVTFSDVITGESQKVTVANSTNTYTKAGQNFFGGTGYTVNVLEAGTAVNITWSSAATTKTVFPRIKLKSGGWIAFLKDTVIPNGTDVILPNGLSTLDVTGTDIGNATVNPSLMLNGINWSFSPNVGGTEANANISGIRNPTCNFNRTSGPAILYIEPKKWDDSTYGNFICLPLGTAGTTEIAVGTPVFNGTNSGFATYDSDVYKSAAVDKYGTLVTMESRTNENGRATLMTPSAQMYLDILFTAPGVTVTAGSAGSGSVKNLGSVQITDAEVSSVSEKNLIVIGGSCVNSLAASLLGSSTPMCGEAFTAKTSVGAGQFLIQTFDRTGGKVATLVAGYNAGDTVNAAKFLTTQIVDTTIGKKYTGTSSTSATLDTTTATA